MIALLPWRVRYWFYCRKKKTNKVLLTTDQKQLKSINEDSKKGYIKIVLSLERTIKQDLEAIVRKALEDHKNKKLGIIKEEEKEVEGDHE